MPQLLISWQRDREGEREGGGKGERERERGGGKGESGRWREGRSTSRNIVQLHQEHEA